MPKRKCHLGDVGDKFPDYVPVALGEEKRLLVPKKMTLQELRNSLGLDVSLADSSAMLQNETMKSLQELERSCMRSFSFLPVLSPDISYGFGYV